jgi:hypothetical protein
MAGLGIQLPVIEKVMNHKTGRFRRHRWRLQPASFAEEKRAALAAWASHIESLLSGKQPANFLSITRGRR